MTARPHPLFNAQVRCRQCRLLASDPQAEQADLDAYYKQTYYDVLWTDPEEAVAGYQRDEVPLIQQMWADFPPPAGGRICEIGCGWGVMLRLFGELGYRTEGCDPSARAVAHCQANGLQAQLGSHPGLPFAPSSFDAVMSLHVVEHMLDPRAFLAEKVALLRPGGVIIVITEDAWSAQSAWERQYDRLRGRVPRFHTGQDHTFVFQGRHLERLLLEVGCDQAKSLSFTRPREKESLHWRLYKGTCRTIDRLLGHGDYLIAAGRRATA